MSERLFIRIKEFSQPIDWGVYAEGADSFIRHGQLDGIDKLEILAPESSGRQVIIVCPAHWVSMIKAEVPIKQQRQLMKALPFMLEDHLAQEVEQLHFATGTRIDDELLGVSCIDREVMDNLNEIFSEAGIYPSYVIPDVLLLPYEPAHWTALVEGDYIVVRDGIFSGYGMEKVVVRDMLPFAYNLCDEQSRPTKLHLFVEDFLVAGTLADDLPDELTTEQTNCLMPLLLFAKNYQPGMPNLLQGEYSRTDRVLQQLRIWKPVGALVAMSLLVQVLISGVDVHHLKQELEQVKQQQEQIFAEMVPGGSNYKMQQQVEQKLASLRGGGAENAGFLQMLAKLENGFRANRGVQPTAFNYEAKRNEIRIDLSAGSYQMLEQFQKAVQAEGLTAELGSANQRDNTFVGRMSVRSES